MRLWIALPTIVALGCGGSSKSSRKPVEPPPTEHWETLSDQRFVHRGGCTIGPFEIALPAREDLEHGRRVAIFVYGPRQIRFDKRIEGDRFSIVGSLFADEGDHSRCRVGDGDTAMPIATTTTTTTTTTPGKPAKPKKPGKPRKPEESIPPAVPPRDVPSGEFPKLDAYTGELPAMHVQVTATGFLPHGDAWYWADEYRTTYSKGRHGMASFRLRFWSDRPQDLDGVIIRVVDQKLVPDLPLAEWHEQYAKRVADADARREARRPYVRKEWDKYVARCTANANDPGCAEFDRPRGRMPPPPRRETPPRAPAPNVEWISGYWSLDKALDDFIWIPGTFVVRAPKVVAVVEPTPPKRVEPKPVEPKPEPNPEPKPEPPAPAPAIEAPVVEAEPARPIETPVAQPPPPRIESLPPPPNVVGVAWVPGYWQLVGARWQWVPGRWLLPPRDHAYRAPSIQMRGNVRFYVPGGWIRRR